MLERAGLIEPMSTNSAGQRAEGGADGGCGELLEEFKQFWSSSFDRLDGLLAALKKADARGDEMTDLPTYLLERVFDAPRELVWRSWTDPQLLPRWYGLT